MMSKKRKNAMLKFRDAFESLLFAANELTDVISEELDEFDKNESIFTNDDMEILGEYGELVEMMFSMEALEDLMSTDTAKNIAVFTEEWYDEHFDEEEGD